MRLPSLSEFKSLFTRKVPQTAERGYREVVAGIGTDNWSIAMLGEDADVWANRYLLLARSRDLFRVNPIFNGYRDLLWSNIFGDEGIMMRNKAKEQEDRVVYSVDGKGSRDELTFLVEREQHVNWLRSKAGSRTLTKEQQYRAFHLADFLETNERSLSQIFGRATATVKVGELDLYANDQIEKAWQFWGLRYADARRTRTYGVIRQMRLIGAVRDGDFFIRTVESASANESGFTLQLINSEWCDFFYNDILPNGNVVRMGIEYQQHVWGIGEPVAYYFIKRQPMDWQFTMNGGFNFASGNLHERISADEIIHYCRCVDNDGTRPAPWAASTFPAARQLDQAMLAEVIAWREAACKSGFYTSTLIPEGGMMAALPDPRTGIPTQSMKPGEWRGLPFGIEPVTNDPKHPNSNVSDYRKASGQNMTAGMPGGDYNVLFSDLENINFSAGRLGRLNTNESSKMIQRNDIDTAERPIFERWMRMALITGFVPLPVSKFKKFNRPVFQARRWRQVDEVKEEQASAMRVSNKKNSRQRECAEQGVDFMDVLEELAEEELAIEAFGMSSATTAETQEQLATDTDDEEAEPKKPKTEKGHGTNGSRILLPS